jgi:hypothetical protein
MAFSCSNLLIGFVYKIYIGAIFSIQLNKYIAAIINITKAAYMILLFVFILQVLNVTGKGRKTKCNIL